MRVGAAALVGLAVVAGLAGWYAAAAIVLGVLFACATRAQPPPSQAPSDWSRWLCGGLSAASQTSSAALFAAVFASYLFGSAAAVAGPLFVLVLGVAEIAGVRVNTYYRRWFTGLALAAVGVFLAICLSIAAVERDPVQTVPGIRDALLAVAVSVVLFTGVRGDRAAKRRYLRFGVATAATLAVAAAAMYQIGPVRFGLSPTTLRDVVTSAEAAPLVGLLAATVVLTTVPACIDALGRARVSLDPEQAGWQGRALRTLPCVVIAAALAGALGPVGCLLVAAAVALLDALVRAGLRWRACRGALAATVFAVAVVLLLAVPAGYLASGLVVAVVGALGTRFLEIRNKL